MRNCMPRAALTQALLQMNREEAFCMGWFTEQIKQRTENDQNVLEDSFFRMASVVMDTRFSVHL